MKALRLYILFSASLDKKISIRDYQLYLSIVVFVLIDSFILIAWFISAPIKVDRIPYYSDKRYDYYYVSCLFDNGFLLGVLIYKTVLCAVVWVVSDLSAQIIFKVKLDRERKKRFRKVNDAVDIKFGITFTLIVLVLVLIVLLIVDTVPLNTFIGLCFTIWIATSVPLGCIMFYVYKDLIIEKEDYTTSTGTSTGKEKDSSSASTL